MADDRIKATIHRVLAIGRSRRSCGLFLEPSYHAMLPTKLPPDGTSMKSAAEFPESDTFQYGPFMAKFIQRFVESEGVLDN